MNIRVPGEIFIYPPHTRRRWFGLRRELMHESVGIVGWWIEDSEFGVPEFFVRHWNECVEAAEAAGTYRDYREGTSAYGRIPVGLVTHEPPRVVWAWSAEATS